MDWSRRIRRAVMRWLSRQPDPVGVEALFTDDDRRYAEDTAALRAFDARRRGVDPKEVGRQERFGAAILDTTAWLEANGFADVGRGNLQIYASWLLEKRAAYEREAGVRS